MKELSNKPKLEVVVKLKELVGKGWPSIVAYVFSTSGRLLAKQSITPEAPKAATGRIELDLRVKQESVVVKIGPDVEDARDLGRYNPMVNKVVVTPEKKASLTFEIEKPGWWCWLKVPYLVTGTVKKQEPDHDVPICFGEVDVYDVDIGYCLIRLPDPIIEHIRDTIIDIVVDPPPIPDHLPEFERELNPKWPQWDDDWCGTPPGKPPHPPVQVDVIRKLEALPPEWAFAKQRFAALSTARSKVASTLEKMPTAEKAAWLNTEAVEGVKVSQIVYSNTGQFRKLLIDKFQAFRFWLCWYPWIYWLWWPYCWYSLEKLGTATLQPDGSFSQKLWLSVCRQDIPDLWFVVRQKINGVERVIYARHPVPCHTYWNHPSGEPVHLIVTDPNAAACYQPPDTDLDPANPWVVPLAIGNYSLKRIYGTGAGSLPADNAKIGLYESIATGLAGVLATFNDGPFGGTLGLRIIFSPALETAGVRYYRIKYRINGVGDWRPLTHEVVRHYTHYDSATKSLEFPPYALGPKTVGSQNALFEIPPINPPNKGTEPDATWQVIDATVDLMNGYFDSTIVANGYVEFKLELFDTSGNRIDPATFGTGGIAFKIPSNTDVWATVTTADAATVNSDLVKSDPENPSFQAFIFRLQTDNRKPTAIIDEPQVHPSGNKTGPCGMIHYEAGDTTATLPYQARHPRKFGMYQFSLYRSTTYLHAEEGQVGDMGASGGFAITIRLKPNPMDPHELNLLGTCNEAAFSENLYIWNMAFNGWWRVGPDASAVRAFALVPKT